MEVVRTHAQTAKAHSYVRVTLDMYLILTKKAVMVSYSIYRNDLFNSFSTIFSNKLLNVIQHNIKHFVNYNFCFRCE